VFPDCVASRKDYDDITKVTEFLKGFIRMHCFFQPSRRTPTPSPKTLVFLAACCLTTVRLLRKTVRFCPFGAVVCLGFLFGTFLAPDAFAGATASNWVVVVNGQSSNSRTIANHYSFARNIPSRNVVVLPNVPDSDQISVDQFRDLILSPVLKEIESRGLAAHIQGIAYSADFPTAITIGSDIDAVPNKSPYLTPVGSINGLTFLFRFVLAKNPAYISFDSNLYAARPIRSLLRPLLATAEQEKQLAALLEQAKHEEAATLLDSLCESVDKELRFPMHYLAAQQWALAGDAPKAIRRIEQSIQEGWQYRDHLLNDPAFVSLVNDKDFKRISKRCSELPSDYLPTRGFDARTFYSSNTLGSNNPKQGVSYMLSMVLAVTRDLGLTPTEAKRNLKTSNLADFSHPSGSFIFTKTEDVRTKTREPNFAIAIRKLQSRGMEARIVENELPPRGEECSGVMLGSPQFSWNQSGCKLLPGSIADNLTSLGGAMTTNAQTKATEFLRFGAAASSGAVTEPYTIPNKFPHPMIHVHYVDGLTAAEAFYSSVLCPYQLLIVGDPLCQPYCNPPRFSIQNESHVDLKNNQPLVISLKTAESKVDSEPELLFWIVNGILQKKAPFETEIRILVENSEPGAHEIRLLSQAEKPIEQRYEQTIWVTLGNASEQIQLQAPTAWQLSDNKPLEITVERNVERNVERDVERNAEAGVIKVLHDFEVVGTIPSGETKLVLKPSQVGYGPVRLHAEKTLANGQTVRSLPKVILVEP